MGKKELNPLMCNMGKILQGQKLQNVIPPTGRNQIIVGIGTGCTLHTLQTDPRLKSFTE